MFFQELLGILLRRPVAVVVSTNGGPELVFASRVPGSRGTLCVHAGLGGVPGYALTHVRSGLAICHAADADQAEGFGVRLWQGLSDDGRRRLRRESDHQQIVQRLLPLDRRWCQAVAAGAKSSIEEASPCPT